MFLRKLAIFLLMLIIIILSFQGCGLFPSTPAKPFTVRPGTIDDPVQLTLSISKAPKLGETSDLTLTSNIHSLFNIDPQSLNNSRAWIEFTWANIKGSYSDAKYAVQIPLDEVLIKGDLIWSGSIGLKDTIELHSTIKLPKEGVWAITGYFTGEGWQKRKEATIPISVTKEAAAVWRSIESRSSPVAYLNNFSYGQIGRPTLSIDLHPIITELDLSKAPKVGEEAILTCHLSSLYDIPDFSVQITFRKRTDGDRTEAVPENNLLINGSLTDLPDF